MRNRSVENPTNVIPAKHAPCFDTGVGIQKRRDGFRIKYGMTGFLIFIPIMLLASCTHKHLHHAHQREELEVPSVSVTQWTDRTELFMEYSAPIAGYPTSFKVHLTDLEGFQPIQNAKVTLKIRGADGQEESFSADFPSRPGIFLPVATINNPGTYHAELLIVGPGINDKHIIGELTVFANEKAARKAIFEEDEHGAITFLKEQQWNEKFNVEPVQVRHLTETVSALGRARLPLGKSMQIRSPESGKIIPGPEGFPLLGSKVREGQILALISAQEGDGVAVESPLTGVIVVAYASPGDQVEKGWRLFDVMDTSSMWVEAKVFEPDLALIPHLPTALIEVPRSPKRLSSNRLVSRSATLDRTARTASLIFEVDNRFGTLKTGSAVTVHIRTFENEEALAVPRSALVDEAGNLTVYVQTGGESFQRRNVTTGVREGDWVEVIQGLNPGERVVTEGAYLVRLTTVAGQIPAHAPAHGHIHCHHCHHGDGH